MFGITLHSPWFIGAAFAAIGVAAALWWLGYRARVAARASYGEARLIDRYSKPLSAGAEALHFFGYACTLLLLGIAAAEPVMDGSPLNTSLLSGSNES